MRKVVYLVATTIDGFIAARDGSIDAFSPDPDFLASLFGRYPETCPGHLRDVLGVEGDPKAFDTVIMGRSTYDAGRAVGITDPYPALEQHVVSSSLEDPDPRVSVVDPTEVSELVNRLKQSPGLDIWLAGGGRLAAKMRDEGLIDEVVIKLNPASLGDGIPLFDGVAKNMPLVRIAAEEMPGGVSLISYRVGGRSGSGRSG